MASMLSRIPEQVVAMVRKNLLLQMRNRVSTSTQLFIGVAFLCLVKLMDGALNAIQASESANVELTSPVPVEIEHFPQCTPGIAGDCVDFLYAPASTPRSPSRAQVDMVAQRMADLAGTPNCRADTERDNCYLGFDRPEEVDAWILRNPNRTQRAVIFNRLPVTQDERDDGGAGLAPGTFNYTLQVNTTEECLSFPGLFCKNIWNDLTVPLRMLVDTSLLAVYRKAESQGENKALPSIEVSFSDMPHPGYSPSYDVMSRDGSVFIYISLIFNFVIQASLIVSEKEQHFVDSMRQMGMSDSARWIGWTATNTLINTCMVLFLLIFGIILDLDVFRESHFGLLFFTMWISVMAFTALAFFTSAFTSTASTARMVGIILFVITYVGAPLCYFVFWLLFPERDWATSMRSALSLLLPTFIYWVPFAKLTSESAGDTNFGLEDWENRHLNLLYPLPEVQELGLSWTMETSFVVGVASFCLLTALAWYFDHVIPTKSGHSFPPWFIFTRGFWFASSAKGVAHENLKQQAVDSPDDDVDVAAEAKLVREGGDYAGRDPAVLIYGLSKTFSSFKAVDAVSFMVDKGQLFVLLGHNGAGKSTTINMLTGLTNISNGDAIIFGKSVKNEIRSIQRDMGVCPQHDVLYNQLTAREHLRMYGSIKGIAKGKLESEIEARLSDVLLSSVGDVLAGNFSGGMKRRLSIAIALLGDPNIVFLDEPTTGMDPVTRREVWDMIARAKVGRVVVLTTHSMEEADILGDRIAVMSHGKIQAIGSSLRLKSRFGGGYRLTMLTKEDDAKSKTDEFMKANAPEGYSLASNVEGALLYQLPQLDDPLGLAPFFEKLETAKDALGCTDFSVGLASLEEVFLNLSDKDKFLSNDQLTNQALLSVQNRQAVTRNQKRTSVTKGSQLNALFLKSLRYQCNNKCTCCFIVTFPLFIMLILLMLELLVLYDLRVEALCGEDVSIKDCHEGVAGTNLTCAKQRYESTRSGTFELQIGNDFPPEEERGGGRRASLEQVDFSDIPLYVSARASEAMGTLRYSHNAFLKEWYANAIFVEGRETCTSDLENMFNEKSCGGEFDLSSCEWVRPDDRLECQKTKRENAQALAWLTQNAAQSSELMPIENRAPGHEANSSASNHTSPDGRGRILQYGGENSEQCESGQNSNGEAEILGKEPSDETKKAIDQAQNKFAECFATESEWKASSISTGPAFISTIQNVSIPAATSGVLAKFTSASIKGLPLEDTLTEYIENYAEVAPGDKVSFEDKVSFCSKVSDNQCNIESISILMNSRKCDELLDTWSENKQLNCTCMESIPPSTAAQILDCIFGGINLYSEWKSCPGTASNTLDSNINGMCVFATNVDAVRQLSFKTFDSLEALHKSLYTPGDVENTFYGEVVRTPLMQPYTTCGYDSVRRQTIKVNEVQRYSKWGAFAVDEADDAQIKYTYTAYFNASGAGGGSRGPQNKMLLTTLMNNAIITHHTGISVTVQQKTFPRVFKCNRDAYLRGDEPVLDCDALVGDSIAGVPILDYVASFMFPYILMIHLLVVVNLIVYEKESKLRMIMKMMGLEMPVYWVVNYGFYFVQYTVMIFLMWQMGSAASLQFFDANDAGVVLAVVLSWGNLLILFGFFLSIFFKSTRTSTAAIFLMMLLLNSTGRIFLGAVVVSEDTTEESYAPLMWMPPMVMLRAVAWLTFGAAEGIHYTTDNWGDAAFGDVQFCVIIMWLEWFALLALLWYFDQVIVIGFGTAKHPLFFTKKSYWVSLFRAENVVENEAQNVTDPELVTDLNFPDDVEAEYQRVLDPTSTEVAVKILRLHKRFDRKVAVRCVSLGINDCECFGLLGHNGAGKSTTISMLSGLYSPTSGNAIVKGHSILKGMSVVHSMMGVCPQENILWDTLSARDHLLFYGRLKGLQGTKLTSAVNKALEDVNLTYAKNRPAGKFSGGMKRRLSVAISLMGNPPVVYLDEPSTGLDPASRRQLWDVISRAKGDKSIVLTTHSMEEADVLCDRLAIMAQGNVQCVGTAMELKQRFGAGYTITLTTENATEAGYKALDDFVHSMFKSPRLLNTPLGGTAKYELNRSEVKISNVFKGMEENKQNLSLIDWGLSETTLEEVFLKLAEDANVNVNDMSELKLGAAKTKIMPLPK